MTWHCGCTFAVGAHDNPHNRHGKPHFPVEDTEVQGREVAGLGLTSTETQHLHPQGRSSRIETTWASETLDMNICLFLDVCCLSWLLRLVDWAHVNTEYLVQEAQMGAHLASGL